ncbi:FadR/GntR family transcriptional regulator [Streptomyces sp. NPDC057611]|uniref:FadR/GntR family transcriptional regulator n=1 Tax=Streptomyces sp. NPDC057611 TaxID=3346182 RepID=UPI0036C9ECAA
MVSSDEELHEADQAFHREVARVSGDELLLLTLDGITPHLHDLRVEAWHGWKAAGKDLEPIIEAHALILDLIRQRDPEGAAQTMRDHLAQAREGLDWHRQPEDASAQG